MSVQQDMAIAAPNGAGVGVRAIASIVDMIVLGIVGYVVALETGGMTDDGFQLSGGPFFLVMLIWLVYYVVLEALWGGTIGKMLTGLTVVRAVDGAKISWSESTIRNVMRIIDGILGYLVGAIAIWTSERHQRFGDRVAGTLVLRKAK